MTAHSSQTASPRASAPPRVSSSRRRRRALQSRALPSEHRLLPSFAKLPHASTRVHSLISIAVLFAITLSSAAEARSSPSRCTHAFSEGWHFDLSSLHRPESPFYLVKQTSWDFEFNICANIPPRELSRTGPQGNCSMVPDSAIYWWNPLYCHGSLGKWAGSGMEWNYKHTRDPEAGVRITFKNGHDLYPDACREFGGQVTHLTVTCADQESSEVKITNDRTCMFSIEMAGPAGCPKYKRISPGSILLILFFVGVALYLAIGTTYKHFKSGTRGWESIPNIDFWRQLPELVTEGFKFTLGSVGGGSRTPGAYETVPDTHSGPRSTA